MLRFSRSNYPRTRFCLTLALPGLAFIYLPTVPVLAETPAAPSKESSSDKDTKAKAPAKETDKQKTPPQPQPASPSPLPEQKAGSFEGGGRPGMMIERIKKIFGELDLTETQKQEMEMIFSEAHARFRELAPQMRDLAPEERRLALRDEMTQLRNRLSETLTPEQREIVQEKVAQMQQAGPFPRPPQGPGFPGSPDKATSPSNSTPEERPIRGTGGGGMKPGTFSEAVLALDLTVDQRQAVNDLLNEQAQKFVGIDPSSPEIQDVYRASAKEVREKLSVILTDEQREQLRSKIMEQGGFRGPPLDGPRPDGQRPDGPRRRPATQPAAPSSGQSSAPAAPLAAVGSPTPDLTLHRLQGPPVKISNYAGKNVVLVFGSQSAPTFREKAQPMLDMQRAIGRRADVMIVYTAEAFPEGTDIRRNREDGIAIAQHATLQDRQAAAQKAIKDLKLTAMVVLDDMNNTAASAFGASPSGAALIGRDGKVLLLQKNFDPHAMAEAVLALPSASSPTPPASADAPATAPAN